MSSEIKNIENFYPKINGTPVTDIHLQLIEIIGKDNVMKIYELIGDKKISFFTLKNIVQADLIIDNFKNSNKTIRDISKEAQCDPKKTYYTLKKYRVVK